MYNDAIKTNNKIISDKDLVEIFQKMADDIKENQQICNRETVENAKLDTDYQHWTTKNFEGTFKCTFNFYDSTNITVDNYNMFITIFNNRLHEIKDMWVRFGYNYAIQNGHDEKYIYKHINMSIYEYKIDFDVELSSEDNKMNNVYELIKNKILNAPERYDRVIKKKNSITSKIAFASGMIPSLVFCTLLSLISPIRHAYGLTFVLYPILSSLPAFLIGNTIKGGRIDKLYSTIIPDQKYAGYDKSSLKNIYKDDIDKFLQTSEVIIGKNIDNLNHRKEILELEDKYSKYIPKELLSLLILSIFMVIIGFVF